MIKSIKDTSVYKSLNLNKTLSHAYLFYSSDKILNNEIAMFFAKTILCTNHSGDDECNMCKQVDTHSHPDYFIIDQETIKVEDVNNLISKLDTKPISGDKKVFVILNFENMNEISQNKLLKSFEEPNQSNIFILTSCKTDKILTTIMSRLTKIFVPKISNEDKILISNELMNQGIDISHYIKLDNLSDIINFTTNENYITTLDAVTNSLKMLNSSADIPNVVSNLNSIDKSLYLNILQELFLDSLLDESEQKFDHDIITIINSKFNAKTILKCLPHIEDAYKKLMSNVNFTYILDNLLFKILKEKYLCNKQ